MLLKMILWVHVSHVQAEKSWFSWNAQWKKLRVSSHRRDCSTVFLIVRPLVGDKVRSQRIRTLLTRWSQVVSALPLRHEMRGLCDVGLSFRILPNFKHRTDGRNLILRVVCKPWISKRGVKIIQAFCPMGPLRSGAGSCKRSTWRKLGLKILQNHKHSKKLRSTHDFGGGRMSNNRIEDFPEWLRTHQWSKYWLYRTSGEI